MSNAILIPATYYITISFNLNKLFISCSSHLYTPQPQFNFWSGVEAGSLGTVASNRCNIQAPDDEYVEMVE
jgi:hypothetical protein